MDDIEKRARELLAAEFEKDGLTVTAALVISGRKTTEDWAVRAIVAALSAAPQVPDGWVLVPVELTDEMMTAAEGCHDDWPATTWRKAWDAMISAKPEPQA